MGVIPSFDGRYGQQLPTNNTAPGTQLYVPPARTSGLEHLGDTVSGIAQSASKIYMAQQERVAADYTTKKSAEIQEYTIRTMSEAKQQALESGNVEGFTDNFLQGFDAVTNQSLESAPNNLAAEAMRERMAQTRNSLLEQSMKFEAAAKIDIYKHNLDTAVDRYSKSAAMDPSQIPNILKQIDGDMVTARKTLGLIDAEERMSSYKGQVVATAISQKIHENPWSAENMVNQYRDDLSAKDFIALNNNAKREQERLEKVAQKEREDANQIASVFGAITGNIPLDPTDVKSQKAFDKYYSVIKKQNPNADLTETVIKTNMMPTQMKNEISGKLANGDVTQKVQAATQLQRLHELSPNLVTKLSKNDKAKASLISSYMQAGVAPNRAVEWAEKEVNIKEDPILKQRAKEAKGESNLKFDNVQGKFTGFFGGGADTIPAAMKSEYELLAKAYYVENGLPADKASDNALNDIRAIWSKSESIGRARYMKNSPEVAYKNGAGTAWIKEQFDEEYLKTKQLDGRVPEKKDIENLIIQPNPVLNKNGNPVYNLYRLDDETGGIDVVLDYKGKPIIYYPNFETSPLYKEMLKDVPGETSEEKRQNYLKEMEEQQIKQLTRGQDPTPLLHYMMPGGM